MRRPIIRPDVRSEGRSASLVPGAAVADLHGLPPLLVIAGGAECLLSCAQQIAANARTAGVDAHLSVYPDKVHGWMLLPRLPATIAAVDEIRRWVADHLERIGGRTSPTET